MVDPNRKINRLTDKDIEFLDECEEEFSTRFTDDDSEFFEHCSKPMSDPPIVENWGHGGTGQGSRNNGRYRNNFDNSGGRERNRWNQESGGRGNRGYGAHRNTYRDRPYQDRRQHERNFDNSSSRSQGRECDNNSSSSSKYSPMNIPKGYGNFVAASKTED